MKKKPQKKVISSKTSKDEEWFESGDSIDDVNFEENIEDILELTYRNKNIEYTDVNVGDFVLAKGRQYTAGILVLSEKTVQKMTLSKKRFLECLNLGNHDFNPDKMVGQTYDEASVMSDTDKGVHTLLSKVIIRTEF
ncbi:hypothetical protein FQR65_LT02369 [Abscondita terminalis]|nr:hypothetical protein FQR65_LT02369 [Abscondita terminalis]